MAKLADAQDLGSCPERGVGSSPSARTRSHRNEPTAHLRAVTGREYLDGHTGSVTTLAQLATPALALDVRAFEHNLSAMAAVRPGLSLRPHVKAHKCTALAERQARMGHRSFTCATPREVIGMANAGLGDDVLLANECLDPNRLRAMATLEGANVTVAVDSQATVQAAADAGLRHVLIDVNVGLPRCGCRPEDAADLARSCLENSLDVRGVMGYEGHLMAMSDRSDQATKVRSSMAQLVEAFDAVRSVVGESCTIVSAGGTGTFDLYDSNDPVLGRVTEVQAGSYALMDTQYMAQGLGFHQAVVVIGTVVSIGESWYVADVGLKSLGMDHGNPSIAGATVWFCSDEHITFSLADGRLDIGDRIVVVPAHVDPTVSQHETMVVLDGLDATSRVLETWSIDLRGW